MSVEESLHTSVVKMECNLMPKLPMFFENNLIINAELQSTTKIKIL